MEFTQNSGLDFNGQNIFDINNHNNVIVPMKYLFCVYLRLSVAAAFQKGNSR